MSHRIALLAFVVASTATAGEPLFKHSDVIAFTAGKLDDYRDYGVDFVAWGGYPRPDAQSVAKFRSNLAESLKVGTRIGAKIGTRTDFAGFIDFAPEDFAESRCIRVDGTPIFDVQWGEIGGTRDCRRSGRDGWRVVLFSSERVQLRGRLGCVAGDADHTPGSDGNATACPA